MKRIAIIGAGGFVGSRFVEMGQLTGQFDAVPVIRSSRSAARLARFGPIWKFARVSHADELNNAISGCDAVVNLTVGELDQIAVTAQNVWESCAASKVRLLIHLSSAEVFGRVENPNLDDDSAPVKNHWMGYARSKIAAEDGLQSHFEDDRVTIIVLRPGLIWGPRSPWVEGPALDLTQGRAFLIGDGSGICNLMFVDNLIYSILGIVNHPSPNSGFYNVADDERTTWRDYYYALAKEVGVSEDAIHRIPAGPYRATLGNRIESLKQGSVGCWAKRQLSQEAKLRAKWILSFLQKSEPISGPCPDSKPLLTQGSWWLQNTLHKLPNRKFAATFGRHNKYSFAEAMARTGQWMRFCGFGSSFEENGRQVIDARCHPSCLTF